MKLKDLLTESKEGGRLHWQDDNFRDDIIDDVVDKIMTKLKGVELLVGDEPFKPFKINDTLIKGGTLSRNDAKFYKEDVETYIKEEIVFNMNDSEKLNILFNITLSDKTTSSYHKGSADEYNFSGAKADLIKFLEFYWEDLFDSRSGIEEDDDSVVNFSDYQWAAELLGH